VIGPEIQHGMEPLPRWRYVVAKAILRLIGWDVKVQPPTDPKLVMMAAPHTSNWDTVLMLLAASVYRARMRFLVKDTFPWPISALLEAFGGVPIDRSGGLGLVDAAIKILNEHDRMLLVLAPSGTRKRTERWRSGFYWIAHGAGVPLVCGILDYGRKEAAFGPRIQVTGDIHADMDAIRAAYADKMACHPDKQTPIRVKEEEEQAPAPESPSTPAAAEKAEASE